jgi:DNA-binding SARP family transcriptional activator
MGRHVPTEQTDGEQTLSVYMLSSFRVLRNGERVNHGFGGKAQQLLKILAAHRRRRLPKDILIEMIWPKGDPEAASISLKVAAHNLRSALDPDKKSARTADWIIAENGTYRLNPDANVWLDTDRFRHHYQQGRTLEAEGSFTEARHEFEKADELYTGDYLEEDMYEDWTVIRREELRDLYLATLGSLANLALQENLHDDVIRYCHKIVLADPCREDAYQMLMRSHGALNQLARAGSWYAVCRASLHREVGTLPSAETVSLFEGLFSEPEESEDLRTA